MKHDPLFYRLFQDLPNCFFQLVGRSERDAENYVLDALEYKATAVRLDGVFRPKTPDAGPAYIWEEQSYASDKVYANLLTKIGHFLERENPNQDWIAVVIYPTRGLEQKNLRPYRFLLDSEQLVRIFCERAVASVTRAVRDRHIGVDGSKTKIGLGEGPGACAEIAGVKSPATRAAIDDTIH